jgi:predicted O-linked N-acetylglucosamine transferase (SPINDLY family)
MAVALGHLLPPPRVAFSPLSYGGQSFAYKSSHLDPHRPVSTASSSASSASSSSSSSSSLPLLTTDSNKNKNSERRIRIGILSGEMASGLPSSPLMSDVIGLLDRRFFEVFCYSTLPAYLTRGTFLNRKFRTLSGEDHWRDVSELAIDKVLTTMRNDDLHIVVDMVIYGNGNLKN